MNFRQGVEGDILEYSIYGRWGELMYRKKSASVRGTDIWWDGQSTGRKAPSGVYLYHIRIELAGGELLEYSGDITLVL